jgi:hypothetical protein
MRKWFPVFIIVAVFLALGISNLPAWRGSTDAQAKQIQVKLDAFPKEIGVWKSEPVEITKKVLSVAQAEAHMSRLYQKTTSSEAFNVLVLVGSPGAMGAHTPEVCYEGLGYERAGKVEKLSIPGETSSVLWTTLFEKPKQAGQTLEVIWGHGVGARWIATDTPRMDFADQSLIFKVYISRLKPSSRAEDDLPKFLELFFQEFRTAFVKK